MEIIDITGKLNNHDDYLKVLKVLKKRTKYIEIVLIDQKKTNHLIEKFSNDILLEKKVNNWWNTKTTGENKLIRIKATKELFKYLEQFETFCKYLTSEKYGEYAKMTDFQDDDIAFYDEDGKYLLFTTTHEGYIYICQDLIKI